VSAACAVSSSATAKAWTGAREPPAWWVADSMHKPRQRKACNPRNFCIQFCIRNGRIGLRLP